MLTKLLWDPGDEERQRAKRRPFLHFCMGLSTLRAPLEAGFGITSQSTCGLDGGIPPWAGRGEVPCGQGDRDK